jgi:4-hydroxy-tetrahydrodipicolinate synthase
MAARTDRRLIAAIATPLTDGGAPDAPLLAARCEQLLADGCDAAALFGTTGEGPCFSLRQRLETVDALLSTGLAPQRLVISTSALALEDAVTLARHAVASAAGEVLLMPLFFHRAAATEEGTYRFYGEVITRVGDPRLRVFLYHFPDITGVPLTRALIGRLAQAHGEIVTGVKDSAGHLEFTLSLVEAFPRLRIYTGTEIHAPAVIAAGGAGTLCGLANVIPKLLRAMIDAPDEAMRRHLAADVEALDAMLAPPFVASLKAVVAGLTGQPRWRRVMPPMAALDDAACTALLGRFSERLWAAMHAA